MKSPTSILNHVVYVLVSGRTHGIFLDRPSLALHHRWRSSVVRPPCHGRCHILCRRLSSTKESSQENDDPRQRASDAFAILANKDKSWQRFRHIVDLAMNSPETIQSVTDVGTDHGLLAVSLALSGRFETVLGVDVSPNALKHGAFQVLDKVQEMLVRKGLHRQENTNHSLPPLDFRLSDGLKQIQAHEADAICIAGMGVNVMTKILQASTNNIREVDRVGCQYLVLQPTNSRPRNLLLLYDTLQQSGWSLREERLECLATRWYLSASFVRTKPVLRGTTDMACLPTSRLALLEENDRMKVETRAYWNHHLKWIRMEEAASGGEITPYDKRWRDWLLCTQDKNGLDSF